MASHRRPAPEGTDLRTHTPALQRRNTLRVTSKATYEGRATGQCGLTPTPSVCTALYLEQAHPLGNLSIPYQQAGNAHLVLERQSSQPPRPDLGVHSQTSSCDETS